MSGTVSIFLDGRKLTLAPGLQVRDLLTPEEVRRVQRGELLVVDARGQERGLGGALLNGATLFRKPGRTTP